MAIRLSIALNTTAESWLQSQLEFDLWRAEQSRKRLKVRRFAAPATGCLRSPQP